jgi:triacylglycerol esterase/lipase EstA (alpha/beta hydrolase family)
MLEQDREAAAARRKALLAGASKVGAAVGRGLLAFGSAIASGYRAIDPDLRRNLAAAPLFGLTMLSSRSEPILPLDDDGHRPLIFVHGLGGHRGNFSPMRAAFKLLGRSRAYSASLPEVGSIQQLGEWLRAVIAEVLAVNALPEEAQVDLVAHSMGGIVCRVALQDAACAARVHTLLTLGTPHHGTHLARLADTDRTRAMRPNSALLDTLSEQIPWRRAAGMPRLICVGSTADVVIIPAETAYVEGAERIELPGFTHSGFLLHPKAFGTVFHALLSSPAT